MKLKFIFFIVGLSIINLQAQNNSKTNPFLNSKDVFGTRAFIENKGQFNSSVASLNNGSTSLSTKIQYAFEHGGENIYFTNKGLIYKLTKHFPITEKQEEAYEHGKQVKLKPDVNYFIEMNWANANPNITIEQSEKTNNYFTYGAKELLSYGYKKITYKNVYNGIDIEYVIPLDKDYGIKYNVIIHPGANINDLKINYSGDINKITKVTSGDIIIKTPLQDITEHAPNSFYENNQKVPSTFTLENNTIGFYFPNNFISTKTLIIDPWVTTITTLATNNYGYDVDYDFAGNLFVYGGTIPFYTSKYSATGVLQWTFNGVVIVPAWNGAGGTNYVSNFCVNRFTGKTYIGQGWVPAGGTRVIRLDVNGIYDNFISVANASWQEVWDMGFQCSTGNVFGVGGCPSANMSCGLINQVSGAVVPTSFMPANPSSSQDITSNTMDDAGNLFVYYTSSNPTIINTIARVNVALTNTVWAAPSTYTVMTYCAMKSNYVAPFAGPTNGFNCLAVNANYLYYYDGLNLAAFNKATGTKIASITIAGNLLRAQGGIDVDDCDNVYLGGNGSILCYKFTGAVFNALASIPLGAATPNKYVFDLKLDRPTNIIYASGSGFVSTYSALHSLACIVNQYSVTPTCVGNNNGTAVASVTTTIAAPVFNYIWTNGTGTISSTIGTAATTNTVTGLTNGTYSVSIQINAPCGPIYTTTVLINCVQNCSLVATASTACVFAGPTTSLNVISTNGFTTTPTYTWTGPGAYTSNTQNNSFLNNFTFGTYTIVATDGGCTYSTTVNTFPVSSFTPVITNTAVLCFGGTTGIANTTVNGGTAPFTYTWTTVPVQNAATANGLPVGTYTVLVTDNLNCVFTATTQVTQPPVLTLAVNSNTPAVCLGNPITANGAAAGGVAPYAYNWLGGPANNNYIVNELLAGSYTYTLNTTDANGCTVSNNINLTFNPGPTITVTSATVCAGDVASITANGAGTYVWQPGNFVGSTFTIVAANNLNITVAGNALGCIGFGSSNITVNPLPVVNIMSTPNKGCVPLCVNLTSNTTNSIVSYSWLLNNASIGGNNNLNNYCIKTPGNYSVDIAVTDVNGCRNLPVPITVSVFPQPTADFNFAGEFSTENPDVLFTDASFNNITSWFWYFGDGTASTSSLQNPVHAFTESNIYTTFLIVKNAYGCSDTTSHEIKILDNPTLYVPNSFTPNGDGFNDGFGAKAVAIKDFKLLIYDRWGEKIFETGDIYKYWDGTINGLAAKEDTYVWLITYSSLKFKAKSITGHVTLIR